ncbi:MAG: thioredoxin domain-containing protein [Chloroflexi bacterium]|nr:thioredoxin domain-containing protein [Chloroflexota bacterium]
MPQIHQSLRQALFFFSLFGLLILAACGPSVAPGEGEIGQAAAPTSDANLLAAPIDPAAVFSAPRSASSSADGEVDANGLPVGFLADGRPYRGSLDAPVVIEEFSDFQCPFCSRFALQTLSQINQNQVASGEVLFLYYDFPLSSIHPQAEAAANATRCAADQGAAAYWDMHDLLFARMDAWGNSQANSTFIAYAEELGLDSAIFAECVQSNKHIEAVRDDVDLGLSRGVSSTPSFFINEQPLIGAQPLEVFNQAIATIQNGGELTANQPANTEPPTPTPVAISEEGVAATLGSAEAPYTIVEFTDYGCAACARYVADTLPTLKEILVDSGQVRYILKDFPQAASGTAAQTAAAAARCAGEQDAYWPMHEALFATQEVWVQNQASADAHFQTLAADLNLDQAAFRGCLSSGQFDAAIQTAVAEGQRVAVGELPYFFIEGYPLSGAEPNSVAVALGLPMNVPIDGAYSIGDPNAPITIVEYTDYQCPFCTRHFAETLPLLRQNFIDTGKVLYVFKDFPLTNIHPQAVLAAAAARCAGAQEAYMPMHDALFTNQSLWSGQNNAADLFVGFAADLGLDSDLFRTCLESGEMETAVFADLNEGMSFGVNGTPAFFINGFLVSGALPYASFEQGLNGLLADSEQQ